MSRVQTLPSTSPEAIRTVNPSPRGPHLTATQPTQTAQKRPAGATSVPSSGFSLPGFALATAALVAGWLIRDRDYYYADQGLGYALGIIGGSMMLLLLLYPLRKRVRFMRSWGGVRHWFRIHMVLGVLGPILILYHCNFHLGSVNSNVALFCMLVVAGSGLIGRYAYSKIHYGLYGSRATLDELQRLHGVSSGEMHAAFAFAPAVAERLHKYERALLSPARNFVHGTVRLLLLGMTTRWTRDRALRDLKSAMRSYAQREGWDRRIARARYAQYRGIIVAHIAAARRVAEFSAYARVFSLWHVLHIPLFFMLLIAGIAHVFAVHAY